MPNPSNPSDWSVEPVINRSAEDVGLYKGFRAIAYAYNGSDYIAILADLTTRALQTIDFPHSQVHLGNHFIYTDSVTLAASGVQDYLITTPNTAKWAHMLFYLDGSAITQWQLYEATDKTGTTAQTIGNSNRNSTTLATITLHKGTAGGTTDGTLTHQYKGGSATNQARFATDTGNNQEIILKQNTKYILRTTSGTDNNLTNIRLEWYEYTNLT